jgi:hypothetical protein
MYCQVVQQLILGDDFLTGIFIGAKEKFNLVFFVFQFVVMIFNHFDNAGVKTFCRQVVLKNFNIINVV